MPSDVAELIRDGYAEVRFTPTYEQVTTRRRRRRPVPFITAIAVLLVALGAGAVVRAGVGGTPNWQTTFAADCDRVWTELARDNPALTPQHQEITPPADHVFAFNDGRLGLRLYVFDPVLFACSRSMTGVVSGSILGSSRRNVSFLPERGEETLNFLAAVGVRPEYVIGRVPKATTGVVATTPDGDITATIDNGFFAAWAPNGGLGAAVVVANRTEGGDLAGHPTALTGVAPNVVSALMQSCSAHFYDLWSAGELTDLAFRSYALDSGWALVAYSSGRVMTICELTDAGIVHAGETMFTAATGQASFAPLVGMYSLADGDAVQVDPPRNWGVVAVPPGTQRGEFVLADGRSIEGQVGDGFMIGYWYGVDTGMPTIRAYTVDTVYERLVDKPVTTRPR